MKVSLNWIRQYVDLPQDLTMEKLSYDLTMRTVEVEGTENPADSLRGVVVGKILDVQPHPQADKLRVCMVDVGKEEPSTIVCGGSNLQKDMLVVVAVPGAMVRWHGEGEPVEIKPAKLRGVLSEGMICASGELDLQDLFPAEDDHEIMDISTFECTPGDLAADVLQLNDVLLEIDNKSMTNRPDLWGHYGLARELAAIYRKELKPLPPVVIPEGTPAYPISIEDSARCHRYMGIVYDGVRNVPSPYWLQLMLWKTGIRPINALVDITNYVMLAVGQPTHGFDKNHVQKEIIVRTACPGETLTLLDGQKLLLTQEDLMICDEKEPMALGGIMGGIKNSILPDTTGMLLEIATFDPIGIRRSATRFQVHTDSAIRNEKGLDTQRVVQAQSVAHELIGQLFPDASITSYGDCYPVATPDVEIPVSLSWLGTRLGRSLSREQAAQALFPLGFQVAGSGDSLVVRVPSWRATGDVSLADDILEEIARMIGYENFDFIPPAISLEKAVNQKNVRTERALKEYLAFHAGMQEVFTYPWVDQKFITAAGIPLESCLELAAPPSPETAHLRSSLVPGMLASIVQNIKYHDSFRIFEMAQVFEQGATHPSEEEETLPLQQRSLAAAFVGQDARVLLREAKGVLENMPRLTMTQPIRFDQVEKPAWADRKAWLNALVGDSVIGSLGVVSIKASRLAGIKRAQAALFEVNVEKIVPLASRTNVYHPLPQFPLVEQDFSILIDEDTPWQRIEALVKNNVQKIQFIEEYRGAQVPEGKKSVMFRVWFGSDTSTLTSEQIEEKMNGIIQKISKKLGGEIRA